MNCQECGKTTKDPMKNGKGKEFCSIRCMDRYASGVKTYGSEQIYQQEKEYMKDYFRGRV